MRFRAPLTALVTSLAAALVMFTLGLARALPDGGQLVYISSRDGSCKIYTVDVLRRLTLRVSEQRILPCCLTWSPDGRRIAFVSNVSSSPEIYVADLAD